LVQWLSNDKSVRYRKQNPRHDGIYRRAVWLYKV
jgi:hypothetical protein